MARRLSSPPITITGTAPILVHLELIDEVQLGEMLEDAWRIKAPAKVRKLHTVVKN